MKRGVIAVQSGNYQAGIDALQAALNETPAESPSVRPRNDTFVYVPHYWLGVATGARRGDDHRELVVHGGDLAPLMGRRIVKRRSQMVEH